MNADTKLDVFFFTICSQNTNELHRPLFPAQPANLHCV